MWSGMINDLTTPQNIQCKEAEVIVQVQNRYSIVPHELCCINDDVNILTASVHGTGTTYIIIYNMLTQWARSEI